MKRNKEKYVNEMNKQQQRNTAKWQKKRHRYRFDFI